MDAATSIGALVFLLFLYFLVAPSSNSDNLPFLKKYFVEYLYHHIEQSIFSKGSFFFCRLVDYRIR